MSRPRTNCIVDEYELVVDEIVAVSHGDMRGALRALMLVNEQLERRLEWMSAQLDDQLEDDPPNEMLQ